MLRPSEPSSGKTYFSGGIASYRLKNTYSTLNVRVSCAIVIGEPQPLPMSPVAAAAGVPGTAAVVAIAGTSSVHRPEKSAGACADVVAMSTTTDADAIRACRNISLHFLRHIRIGRVRRHIRILLHRRRELVDDAIGDALYPRIRVLDIAFFFRIGQQVEQSHQRRHGRTTGLGRIDVMQFPVVPFDRA